MSLAIVYSRAAHGIEAPLVSVEVHMSNGLPALAMVGLPETAVRESKDRVRGALLNSNYEFPPKRFTVNLAPAELPKEGSRYDLPIALAILAASHQLDSKMLTNFECIGELALSGEVRPVRGVLPVAIKTREAGRTLIVPRENMAEAMLVSGLKVLPVSHLLQVTAILSGQQQLEEAPEPYTEEVLQFADLSDVKGQHQAKRALEIAAAGAHNLLFIGPPGTGKSMLATRLPGILPPLSESEALETAAVLSIADRDFNPASWRRRPFRSPHHTASGVALVGGGGNPRPGEISLAHNGVLFMDELPEFDRRVLEVLREPLETGKISISRAARQAEYPARFQLVAAMNPCPCGYLADESGRCHCTQEQVQRYRNRVSGPLLDRIDIQLEMPRIRFSALCSSGEASSISESAQVRQRVVTARAIQMERCGKLNAHLSNRQIEQYCEPDAEQQVLLERVIEKFHMSSRAYHRILKLARTIADLAETEKLETTHVAEAIGYRRTDKRVALPS